VGPLAEPGVDNEQQRHRQGGSSGGGRRWLCVGVGHQLSEQRVTRCEGCDHAHGERCDGKPRERQVLRIGAVATLSRNFQKGFVRPLLGRTDVELVLQSGSLGELLPRLGAHALDVVLSNHAVQGDAQNAWRCQRIARQAVSLVGAPRARGKPFRYPDDLAALPLIVPSSSSDIRTGFDLLCERLGVRCTILAEVDDMAMLRLLARAAPAASVVPTVVVRDELRDGRLEEYCQLPSLYESFFAISVKRQHQHPLLKSLLAQSEAELLTAPSPESPVTEHSGLGARPASRARRAALRGRDPSA
jgi:LysR family transcriptional regulator, transcriptional activator of nhaA